MKLVLVEWHDAVSGKSGWRKKRKIRRQKCERFRSVGWVIRETSKKITLIATDGKKYGSGDVTIPLGWVQSMRELAVK